MPRQQSRFPMSGDRLGWHNFYAAQFNYWAHIDDKHNAKVAAHLSLWYLFLHLSEGTPT